MADYKEGDIIKAEVSGITKYGIFVHVDSSYNGLIHISEVSNDFVSDINEYVKMGEVIYCQVLEVNEIKLQLKLSIKNINYKTTIGSEQIVESRRGFLPLKNELPKWIAAKVKEYKIKE